jgi:antirestriction protein ArdC
VQNAVERDATAEAFLKATGAGIRHGGNKAFYVPSQDFIQMPQIEAFKDTAAYYGTAFHEISHWAGHESRLHRDLTGRFGSAAYSLEEIISELAASFTCADLGLEPVLRDDHANYIGTWIKVLKDKPRAIVTAASEAQRAVDYVKGLQRAAQP